MMNKIDNLEGCLFQLKSKPNCLIEIEKLEVLQAKVLAYNEDGSEYDTVDVSDLKGIPMSIPILESLGFDEKEGYLMGLPNTHYWEKQIDGYYLWIVDDDGVLKQATIDADACYGVRFTPAPYLHEMQTIIGSVDVAKLFKDLNYVNGESLDVE